MQLKKKTSMMLVAASTAAIMGIAAVSFAAWQGNAPDTLEADASTGTLNTFGFDHDASFVLSGTNVGSDNTSATTKSLVPYNQAVGTVLVGAYMLTAQLPSYTVNAEDYKITVSATATCENAEVDLTAYTLYAKLTKETVELPADGELTGWTELDDTEKAFIDTANNIPTGTEKNETANTITETETLYVILVSNDVAQPASAIDYTINVTLTSASHTPATNA